jgi:hypothetical protein
VTFETRPSSGQEPRSAHLQIQLINQPPNVARGASRFKDSGVCLRSGTVWQLPGPDMPGHPISVLQTRNTTVILHATADSKNTAGVQGAAAELLASRGTRGLCKQGRGRPRMLRRRTSPRSATKRENRWSTLGLADRSSVDIWKDSLLNIPLL